MGLSDVVGVSLNLEQGVCKYIVAKVWDTSGQHKVILRSYPDCDFHNEMVQALAREVAPHGFVVSCLGGGMLNYRPHARAIFVSGLSSKFGMEPDRHETVRMLEAAFPDFRVESF